MPHYRMIMLSQAMPGREADYERWYDEVHIPDMLQVPGFTACQRFRVVKNVVGETSFPFCTIYELETESADAATNAMFAALQDGRMRMSDSVDTVAGQGFICEEIRPRVTAVSAR